MKQRSDELVLFISRTVLAAGIAIIVGSGVLLALFYRRNVDEGWARHSREVSRLAREVEIAALQRVADGASAAPVDGDVAAKLDSLRRLTGDMPVQRARADRIAAAFAGWSSPRMPAGLQAELAAFLATEEQLYDERTAAAHGLDRVLITSAAAALVIMLGTLYVLRLRVLTSELRFRTLVNSLHDVVFTLGRERRYTGMYGGRASREPDAYVPFLGKTAVEILGPQLGQVHVDAADRALAGETVTYEWVMPDGDRQRHYTNTVSPLRGPAGDISGVVGINRDVTEQVMRDKALTEAREQLRQAQRLDALGQLAGGVAHDFNNLLTVIMTYAAILQEEAEAGSDTARSIDEIRVASERAAALTRQLLAFGRRQVLQPRPTDLNETVREVERMLRRLLPPDIAFETNLSPALGLVMADAGQLEQVLINLAINARDAMPEGGRLTIGTSESEAHVVVTVSDTGVGMSRETMSKIFEPFFTTKDVGKGTGLGLATVHGIVEQSGGRVTVESQVGRGTTFEIRLPRLAAPVAAAPRAAEPEAPLRGTETILLVDDNEELRRVVKRMLARAGYAVIEAASGTAALAQLERGAAVDVVLTDVMMPELNGRGVVEAIRQRHRGVRVLLMSGYNSDIALRGMAQRGDVAFIEKPFTAEKLLRRLREVLGHTTNRGAA